MRVLIVNTSEKTGGAAVAANRLMEALNNNGVKAKMLVRDKETEQITVVGIRRCLFTKWHFILERLAIFFHLHFSKDSLFQVDIANTGFDITKLREFREADIIHLSWINQGMLSLGGIRKIIKSGKPVVWTMHDLWPATGICHYTHNCTAFQDKCHNCQYINDGSSFNDLSSKVFRKKKKIYANADISFVACSKWLRDEAKKSTLLAEKHITNIPNPINTNIYCQTDKKQARDINNLPIDKKVILFVSQKVTDKRKGIRFFVDAINMLSDNDPDFKDHTCVAVLGGHAEDVTSQLSLPSFPLGYISDEKRIISVYNSADVFVLPSLEDNLPNTIMEAMACGVPCVGFNVGGIPEMIDHKRNGYIAKSGDADDLASGMRWILYEADYGQLIQNSLKKVSSHYSQHSVAMKYMEIYDEVLAFKNYRL